MAPTRKPRSRTVSPKTGAKHKGAQRRPVNAKLPQSKRTSTTELPTKPPGFLIVVTGASACGLEAMEVFFRHMSPSSGMAFIGHKMLALTGRRLLREAGHPGRILLAMEEVSVRQGEG